MTMATRLIQDEGFSISDEKSRGYEEKSIGRW